MGRFWVGSAESLPMRPVPSKRRRPPKLSLQIKPVHRQRHCTQQRVAAAQRPRGAIGADATGAIGVRGLIAVSAMIAASAPQVALNEAMALSALSAASDRAVRIVLNALPGRSGLNHDLKAASARNVHRVQSAANGLIAAIAGVAPSRMMFNRVSCPQQHLALRMRD